MRRLIVAAVGVSMAVGCVRYTRADTDLDGRFDALWERRLADFQQQLDVENHTGSVDDWTHVGEAWMALVNCDDIESPSSFSYPSAAFVHATLAAEDTRRRMRIARAASRKRRLKADAIVTDVRRDGFFEREPTSLGTGYIEWPPGQEGWVDEMPAPVPVESNCGDIAKRVLAKPEANEDDDQDLKPKKPRSYDAWVDAYIDAAGVVVRRFQAVGEEARAGAFSVQQWRVRFYVAKLAHETGAIWRAYAERLQARAKTGQAAEERRERAARAVERASELEERAYTELSGLVEAPDDLPTDEAGRATLLLAWYELERDRPSKALELLGSIRDAKLGSENFWTARYLELRVASEAARWQDAAQLADALPPRKSAVHGAYFYRTSVALKRIGAEDRFLNVAMKAFRDRPYKEDPFLRALYWETLQTLAEYPFDQRIIELLEEMGPRSETFLRVDEYARIALDRGRTENAQAAARWLLARDRDARFHPRYRGLLALAAFLDDDVEGFTEAAEGIVERPGTVLEAVPSNRRPTFFRHADEELARVLRQMLPVMAEWGDSSSARERRQRWLRVIVDHAQSFVRESDETLARPQLVELYRLASALLEDHPRGYAERVGEQEPAPLVLGTVRLERRDLEQFEPRLSVELPTPYSLTIIPRDELPMSDWPTRWEAPDDGDEEDS
jgi:hypothetical protein